ncbi:MAG: hypothetical protein ACK476_18015, partial [Fluviicola sp.]
VYTLYETTEFFPGFHVGVQTAVPSKRTENKYFCFGVDFNYFAIKATRKIPNHHIGSISTTRESVLSFIFGSRKSFTKKPDNYFQWGVAFNICIRGQAAFGLGPRFSFGFKVIDRDKHKFFLSPQLGLNLFIPSNETIVMPIYSYASLRMIYQFTD